MTRDELQTLYARHLKQGLKNVRMCFVMKAPRKRIRSQRIQTPFGLCKYSWHSETHLVIYPFPHQVKRWLDMSVMPEPY